MNKQILAVSIGAVLVMSLVVPSMSSNSFAQVTSESRVLQAILGLTEVVKGQTEDMNDTLDNIEDDLLFKKKFWQFMINTTDIDQSKFQIIGDPDPTALVGVRVDSCELPPEACAFNVESIQFIDNGVFPNANISRITVDGVDTDISGKNIMTSSNLLVDSGIGKIGASQFVEVLFGCAPSDAECPIPFSGIIEINGEKPQGMELCLFIDSPGGRATNCDEIEM